MSPLKMSRRALPPPFSWLATSFSGCGRHLTYRPAIHMAVLLRWCPSANPALQAELPG
jgi:hypothetical protein